MTVVHTIQLRGSWTHTIEGGKTILSREFGAPRSVPAGESVWLVGRGVTGPVEINGIALPGHFTESSFEVEVTSVLKPRNTVRIRCSENTDAASVAVCLEFRM